MNFPHRLLATCALVAFAPLVVACGPSTDAKDPSEAGGTGDSSGTSDTANGTSGKNGDKAAPEVGKPAPEVAGVAVMGDGPKTIAEAKGQVVIVDFWATFCDPCRKSFPQYQELVDKHSGNLSIIAVSVDDPDDVTDEDVKKFATDLGVSFSIIWDKTQKTAGLYSPPKMPTSYIIDKEGVIRHIHEGFESGEADEIDKEVSALLE